MTRYGDFFWLYTILCDYRLYKNIPYVIAPRFKTKHSTIHNIWYHWKVQEKMKLNLLTYGGIRNSITQENIKNNLFLIFYETTTRT